REVARVVAARDGQQPDLVRHAVVEDGVDAVCDLHLLHAEPGAERAHHPMSRLAVEFEIAPDKIIRVEIAEHDTRVGQGRLSAAGSVAGWSGHRASALRADMQTVRTIEPG